jgi:propanol-preferring alcohol dehydrogenase
LPVAQQARIETSTRRYPLDAANEALCDLRDGRIQGAAVLTPT